MSPQHRACGACGFQPDTLSPADAIVALRSFPRRWRELLAGFPADEGEDAAVRRRLAGGWSALEHVAHVSQALSAQAERLERIRHLERPTIGPVVTPEPGIDEATGAEEVVAELGRSAERLATVAESMVGEDWLRAGIREGQELTALELLREGVHEGAHHLHEADALLERIGARQVRDNEER